MRGVGRDVSAREPVELERAASALVFERPLYPPEAPARNPLAHVRVRGEVFHVVVERAGARLVQLAETEAARAQLSEEPALEPAVGLKVVVLYHVPDDHQHAAEEADD